MNIDPAAAKAILPAAAGTVDAEADIATANAAASTVAAEADITTANANDPVEGAGKGVPNLPNFDTAFEAAFGDILDNGTVVIH